jgi:cyclophilin family peptidyl-prolyl cis-trans isomerase
MLFNEPGVLGMAKSAAPNSAGSQYFITEVPYPSLNWNYAAFGNIVEGFNVIQAISDVPTDGNDKPLVDVVIDSLRIMTASFFGVTPEQDSLNAVAGEQLAFGLLTNDPDVTFSWFVDEELQTETSFIYNTTLSVNGSHEIKGIGSKNGYEYYRIWFIEITGGTGTDLILEPNIDLYQNIPNPFNPTTTISFELSNESNTITDLSIYNMKGQLIKTLVSEPLGSGIHSYVWNGTDDADKNVSSGIYFYKLTSGSYSGTRKAVMLK